MIVIPEGSSQPLRGDVLVRAILRSDLTPIPQTVELDVRDVAETKAMAIGSLCAVGRDGLMFRIVKEGGAAGTGHVMGARGTAVRTFVGLLASCEAMANPRQRAVISYGTSLGAAYRACGAQISVKSDIAIPVFSCLKGMTPSFEAAKALQESAAAIVSDGRGAISFKRLADLRDGPVVRELREDSGEVAESPFVERHLIPFSFSTDAAGAFVFGRAESGRGVVYRPQATRDVLNNLSAALVTRRKVKSMFSPDILAGDVISMAGEKYVVVTAAHVFGAGGAGPESEQSTTLWLGSVVGLR